MDEPIDLAQKAAEKGNPWFGLAMLFQPESHRTGIVTDEDGTEHEVYRHVFTPPGMTMENVGTLLGRIDTEEEQRGMLPLADIQALQEQMFNMAQGSPDYMVLSPYQAANWERWERRVRHSIPRERSKRRRAERWHKIRKRQRRAAQRRHARGGM